MIGEEILEQFSILLSCVRPQCNNYSCKSCKCCFINDDKTIGCIYVMMSHLDINSRLNINHLTVSPDEFIEIVDEILMELDCSKSSCKKCVYMKNDEHNVSPCFFTLMRE